MYWIWLGLSWTVSLMVSAVYILFTRKLATGNYGVPDVLLFSVLNGVLEVFMFVFWFLLGCWVARLATCNSMIIFTGGFLAFVIYSGFIHVMFWVKVLPAHVPAMLLMLPLLSFMSLLWMWVFWRYRSLIAIIAMHIVMDFVMIGYLNSLWLNTASLAG